MANREKETVSNPKITIVIGTLNRPNVVMSLIRQLVEESKKNLLEVIVIDQSTPENYKDLRKNFPEKINFKLTHFDRPNTVKYLNYGWIQALSPIVLFLDDDVALTERTIKAHIEAYEDSLVNGVAGRVINDGEKISRNSNAGSIKWFGAIMSMNFSFDKEVKVNFPYGCNMSFRKNILKGLKGFDENLLFPSFAYLEADLGYRLSKKWPKSLLLNPQALVYHHRYKTGGTRNNYSRKEIFHSDQFNYGYFLGKNFSWTENSICFLRRLPYQIIKEPKAIPDIFQGFIYGKKIRKKII